MMKKLSILILVILLCSCGSQNHVLKSPTDYQDFQIGTMETPNSFDHKDSVYFSAPDYFNMQSKDSLHILSHFYTYQQTTNSTCGPACLKMIFYWFGLGDMDEIELAKQVETIENYGTVMSNLLNAYPDDWKLEYHLEDDKVFDHAGNLASYVIKKIDSKVPIVVSSKNHLSIIIGIDTMGTEKVADDVLIFADPNDIYDHNQDGYRTENLMQFFDIWSLENRTKCQAYIVGYKE